MTRPPRSPRTANTMANQSKSVPRIAFQTFHTSYSGAEHVLTASHQVIGNAFSTHHWFPSQYL
jgi:hypothetical protein